MRASGLAGVLAASLVLAGCSNDADGDPAPSLAPVTPSSSASPSATAGGGATDVPAEAQAATPEGAAAFGRFFYDSVEQSFRTLDASTLRAISDPACEICMRYINSVESFARDGYTVEGNDITITDAIAPAGDMSQEARATVFYRNTAGRVLDASGAVVLEEPARDNVVVELVLERADESWTVTEVRSG